MFQRLFSAAFLAALVGGFFLASMQSSQAAIVLTGGYRNAAAPYNGTDNSWNSSYLEIGYNTPGSLTVDNGFVINSGYGTIGQSTGADGSSVTITGANSKWLMSGLLTLGTESEGTLTVTDGATVTASSFTAGYLSLPAQKLVTLNVGGGTGTSTLNTTVISPYSIMQLGYFADTIVNIKGGGSIITNQVRMAEYASSTSIVNVGDGTGPAIWSLTQNLQIGVQGTASIKINSGGLVIAPQVFGNSTSKIQFDGGTFRGTGAVYLPPIELLAGGGTLDVTNTNTIYGSSIVGSGSLRKTGQGTLVLFSDASHPGETIIEGGTLKLQSSVGIGPPPGGSFSSSPLITIGSGATLDTFELHKGLNYDTSLFSFSLVSGQTLRGNGTVLGATVVPDAAVISPGINGIGTTLTHFGKIRLTGATSLLRSEIDLGGSLNSDLLTSYTGGVSLSGSTLELDLLNVPNSPLEQTFILINNRSVADVIAGTFGTVNVLGGAYTATLNYNYSGTDAVGRIGDGNDLAVTLTPVPEPGTLILSTAGIAGVIGLLRRRRASTSRCYIR